MPELKCPSCGAINRIPESRLGQPARCGRCKTPLSTAGPVTITDATFDEIVLRSRLPVLVDCWAAWCQPCHMLAPTIDALARDYAGRVIVGKLDIDANPTTASRFQVRSIPTVLLFRDGQLVDRIVGVQPRSAFEASLQPLLSATA